MSGRIRRLLQTVPKGAVDLRHVPALASGSERLAAGDLSPAGWLAQRLLAERLSDFAPQRCRVIGPGRLLSDDTLPFKVVQQPLSVCNGGVHATTTDIEFLLIGDALAAEDDPPAVLGRLVEGFAPYAKRLLAVLPGTALMPDDATFCPRRWLFSESSGVAMARHVFGERRVSVMTFGNALVATSELLGLAANRLWPDELSAHDPQYPMVVAIDVTLGG